MFLFLDWARARQWRQQPTIDTYYSHPLWEKHVHYHAESYITSRVQTVRLVFLSQKQRHSDFQTMK